MCDNSIFVFWCIEYINNFHFGEKFWEMFAGDTNGVGICNVFKSIDIQYV